MINIIQIRQEQPRGGVKITPPKTKQYIEFFNFNTIKIVCKAVHQEAVFCT